VDHVGKRVEFSSNGHPGTGYLAVPEQGRGPAIVVIQEWWGLVPHIERVVDRLAREDFAAIAPDLYHGRTATSPDEAKRLRMEVDVERAEREIAGAASFVLSLPDCSSTTFGVVGFCMGGALAQYTATKNAGTAAAVSFYGGFKKVVPHWPDLGAPLLLIYGANDASVPPQPGRELAASLQAMGKDVTVVVYPGADHAFFNEDRPEVYHAASAADAWKRTIDFFRRHVH
jgi:carboxymethylenebutenolidase